MKIMCAHLQLGGIVSDEQRERLAAIIDQYKPRPGHGCVRLESVRAAIEAMAEAADAGRPFEIVDEQMGRLRFHGVEQFCEENGIPFRSEFRFEDGQSGEIAILDPTEMAEAATFKRDRLGKLHVDVSDLGRFESIEHLSRCAAAATTWSPPAIEALSAAPALG